jgi:hypothetical protein
MPDTLMKKKHKDIKTHRQDVFFCYDREGYMGMRFMYQKQLAKIEEV